MNEHSAALQAVQRARTAPPMIPANASRPTVMRPPSAVCRTCGHALATAPARGDCPGCGQPYDVELLLLHGRSRDGMADRQVAWHRVYRPAVALSGIVVTQLIIAWDLPFSWRTAYIVAGTAGVIAILAHRARQALRPEDIDIRMNARGCVRTRSGVEVEASQPEGIAWSNVSECRVEPLSDGRARLFIRRRPEWWQRKQGRSSGLPALDADIAATAEDVAELTSRIARWRGGAANTSTAGMAGRVVVE